MSLKKIGETNWEFEKKKKLAQQMAMSGRRTAYSDNSDIVAADIIVDAISSSGQSDSCSSSGSGSSVDLGSSCSGGE